MEAAAILALVTKGILIAQALIEAGETAAPAIAAIYNVVTKDNADVTDADLAVAEAVLDAQIAEFNLEIDA